MARKPIDLTNRQFGKLKVIKQVGSDSHGAIWLCECKCGCLKKVRASNLLSGHTTSCRCAEKKDKAKKTPDKPKLSKKETIIKAREAAKLARHYADGTYINRIKSKKPNRNNTSGIKGVTWDKKQRKWVASINFKRKRYYLGARDSKGEAAALRQAAELQLHDKFVQWWEEGNG